MSRYRIPVALLCIGLVLFAAFTPGTAASAIAIVLDPVWDPFIPLARVLVRPEVVRTDAQTRALLSVLASRPPPSFD